MMHGKNERHRERRGKLVCERQRETGVCKCHSLGSGSLKDAIIRRASNRDKGCIH